MNDTKSGFFTSTKLAVFIGCVWGTLLFVDFVSSIYFEKNNEIAYEQVPEYLKLKSDAKDVLHSDVYMVGEESLVRYAYPAEVVSASQAEDVSLRTPVSQTEVLAVTQEGNKITKDLKTTFFSLPQFYQKDGEWYQIEYGTTTPEVFSASGAIKYVTVREWWEKILPGKPVFAAVSTFYPDANTESTSVDGHIQNVGTGGTISNACINARGAYISGSVGDAGTTMNGYAAAQSAYVQICYIWRNFLLFDTSSLPDSAPITAASLSIYVTSNPGASTYLNVFSSNPASNTALATSDWASVGGTQYSTALLNSSMTTSAYNTFSLNSSGQSNITKTGVSKFSIRTDHDYSTNFPPGTLVNQGAIYSSADETGTSQDPKLEVTYTDTSFSFGQWFPF